MGGPPPQGMMMVPPHPMAVSAGVPIHPGPAGDAYNVVSVVDKGKKKAGKVKKEKAIKKTQILETPWFIVVTNLDNTFFYNKETKTSLWVPTPELEKALAQMGDAETEKLKKKMEEEEEEARKQREQEAAQARGTEMTEDDVAWQLAMMEDGEDLGQGNYDEEDESSDDEQMKERLRQLQGLGSSSGSQGSRSAISSSSMAAKYTTQEDKEQAFMTMLRERGVTQFDTWSKVLERTEGDARMLLIADKKARQDLFDNFCVIKSEEVEKERKMKEEQEATKSKDGVKGKGKDKDRDEGESESKLSQPEEVYRKLMEDYTTANSTWLDFYTKYRTDPRFLGLKPGSLRESIFRQYLADLKKGKIKSKAVTAGKASSSSSRDRGSSGRDRKYKATKDEIDEFTSLLKEIRKDILYDHKKYGKVEWRSLKKLIDRDRRYDAVGSSTEREWIFEEYVDKVTKD
ncbi:transcription elongation regulator [Actinomortierella ambigua]|uniref:Transcription elongation regulator n=1 Tax=Actinomortierella ambigua TaxID=1343610 RepID=A0A9P6QJ69_9FUNG|nr:transcription elongation regulator [Actinomortierella ambigua]